MVQPEGLRVEGVLAWFRQLSPAQRVDFSVKILDQLHPLEARFLNACIDEVCRKDYYFLRESEASVNSRDSWIESDDQQFDLAADCDSAWDRYLVALSLLHPFNYAVASTIYRILFDHISSRFRYDFHDFSPRLELLLTMVARHPAFKFEYQMFAHSILCQLRSFRQSMCHQAVPTSANGVISHYDDDSTSAESSAACNNPTERSRLVKDSENAVDHDHCGESNFPADCAKTVSGSISAGKPKPSRSVRKINLEPLISPRRNERSRRFHSRRSPNRHQSIEPRETVIDGVKRSAAKPLTACYDEDFPPLSVSSCEYTVNNSSVDGQEEENGYEEEGDEDSECSSAVDCSTRLLSRSASVPPNEHCVSVGDIFVPVAESRYSPTNGLDRKPGDSHSQFSVAKFDIATDHFNDASVAVFCCNCGRIGHTIESCPAQNLEQIIRPGLTTLNIESAEIRS